MSDSYSGPWHIVIPQGTVPRLRASADFHLFLLAAKMSESLKFAAHAIILTAATKAHAGDRQRMWGILHLCAALNEVRDWYKRADATARTHPVIAASFSALNAVPKNQELERALGLFRNKVLFHHDIEPFSSSCANLPDEEITLAEASSTKPIDSDWLVPQFLMVTYALGLDGDLGLLQPRMKELLAYVDALARAFVIASDRALIAHAATLGISVRWNPSPVSTDQS